MFKKLLKLFRRISPTAMARVFRGKRNKHYCEKLLGDRTAVKSFGNFFLNNHLELEDAMYIHKYRGKEKIEDMYEFFKRCYNETKTYEKEEGRAESKSSKKNPIDDSEVTW